MLLAREQLGAGAVFAGDDFLSFVRVDPDGSVWATNGSILVKVTRQAQATDVDYPVASLGLLEAALGMFEAPILIPREDALRAMKNILKLRPSLPALNHAYLAVTTETYYLCTTNLNSPSVVHVKAADLGITEKFPDVTPLLRREAKRSTVNAPTRVSGAYLSKIGQYAKTFKLGRSCRVKLTPHGPDNLIEFSWEDGGGGLTVRGLVAPIRL